MRIVVYAERNLVWVRAPWQPTSHVLYKPKNLDSYKWTLPGRGHPYEEFEPKYPEVDEIVDRATADFGSFLQETFKSQYEDIQRSLDVITSRNEQLSERARELSEKAKSLQKREETLQKDEEKQYQKFKQQWFHTLGLDLDIGDIVYYYKTSSQNIDCPRRT